VIDTVESYRDMVSSMVNLSMWSICNRMYSTIIATVFIPLTFVAGIYGMNFDPEASLLNMPELSWAFGYPAVLGLMGLLALVIVIYFKRKKWF
jgi:magnesium transporter